MCYLFLCYVMLSPVSRTSCVVVIQHWQMNWWPSWLNSPSSARQPMPRWHCVPGRSDVVYVFLFDKFVLDPLQRDYNQHSVCLHTCLRNCVTVFYTQIIKFLSCHVKPDLYNREAFNRRVDLLVFSWRMQASLTYDLQSSEAWLGSRTTVHRTKHPHIWNDSLQSLD